MTVRKVVYTVGHSNHPFEKFVELLMKNGITAVADVRSSPYSRHNPQFNKEELTARLKQHGIAYVFVGKELGARSDDPDCYVGGKVQYGRLAQTPIFKAGIERVMAGAGKYRVALMCAEKEPLDCHRTLLVAKALDASGVSVHHILADGNVEPHKKTMARLLDLVGLPREDMFRTQDELIEEACHRREDKIAYVDEAQAEQL
jgi:uncharacterized protein (DUF488 family)